MLDLLISKMHDTKFIAMPLLSPDTLGKRMKSVALEREKIRQRERERLARVFEQGASDGHPLFLSTR